MTSQTSDGGGGGPVENWVHSSKNYLAEQQQQRAKAQPNIYTSNSISLAEPPVSSPARVSAGAATDDARVCCICMYMYI